MSRTTEALLLATLILATLILEIGCGGGGDPGIPYIDYGAAECAACRMTVSDPRYAAAVRDTEGEVRAFDSIECLITYLREAPRPGLEIWVADHAGTDGLHPAETMTVVLADFQSPMGKGYAAFRDPETAALESDRRQGVSGPLGGFVSGSLRRGS